VTQDQEPPAPAPAPDIDATLTRPRTGTWTLRSDLSVLSIAHRQQLSLYRAEQRAVQRRIKAARKTNPNAALSQEDAARLTSVTTFLARCTSTLLEIDAARAKVESGLDPDMLLEQLRYEFARAAWSYTDDELVLLARGLKPRAWAVLDRIRCERTGAGQWIADTEVA
jgi:hypothetical protein